MPALRMAANLVGRRIAAAVAHVEAEPPPVRAPRAPCRRTEPRAAAAPVRGGAPGNAPVPRPRRGLKV